MRWVNEYQKLGEKAFAIKLRNNFYSKGLKEVVIREYLNGEGSLEFIFLERGIISHSILLNWVNSYNRHETVEDYNPKREVYMKRPRKTFLQERIEIVKRCIKQFENQLELKEEEEIIIKKLMEVERRASSLE